MGLPSLVVSRNGSVLAFVGEALVDSMTAPLRRAHFVTWIVLPLLMAAIFVASLTARHSTTPNNAKVHWESVR